MNESHNNPLDMPGASLDVPELTAEQIQARVLHRDGLMLVVDKPCGLPVHRGPKGGANLETSFDFLRFGLPRPPVLAHRLDKDTSGCLVLGRHRKATASLGLLFKHGKIGKTYWAVVEGGPAEDEGTIDMPLGRLNVERGWWQKPDPEGQKASRTGRCAAAAMASPGSIWNRSPAAPISCACTRRPWAGRSSATTSTARRQVYAACATKALSLASANLGCICTPARS